MLQERVYDDIYVFTSDVYAQVTAGLIVTPKGGIVIDSLPFPTESHKMARFARHICSDGVQYVILTHYHSDHTYGAHLFPQAEVVSHALCRDLIVDSGRPALKRAQEEMPELEEIMLPLPDVTFDEGDLLLHLGGWVVRLIHSPGHTADSIMVYVENASVLFAGDTVMPVPSIVDGDMDVLRNSLKKIDELQVENMVQGHGEVILRGEVSRVVQATLDYLDAIEGLISEAIKEGRDRESLQEISIEECGLPRLPLNGLVQQIHMANLLHLYDKMK